MNIIEHIRSMNVSSYVEIIRILVEHSEKMSKDGTQKLNIVMNAWEQLIKCQEFHYLKYIKLQSVSAVIETLIYASRNKTKINQSWIKKIDFLICCQNDKHV